MSMRRRNTGERGGFTIIEVVLVLAIAGLIFLMVFIAFPVLSRTQRDTQRRQNMSELASRVLAYQENNSGRLPADGSVDSYEEGSTGAQLANWCSSGAAASGINSPAGCFVKRYLNAVDAKENKFTDPQGSTYALTIMTLASGGSKVVTETDYAEHRAYIVKHAQCNEGGEDATYSSNPRDYAVMLKLEGAGSYCQDNNS